MEALGRGHFICFVAGGLAGVSARWQETRWVINHLVCDSDEWQNTRWVINHLGCDNPKMGGREELMGNQASVVWQAPCFLNAAQTKGNPCRPAACSGKTIRMVSRAFKIPLPCITPYQCCSNAHVQKPCADAGLLPVKGSSCQCVFSKHENITMPSKRSLKEPRLLNAA